jgi:hypothetical protein
MIAYVDDALFIHKDTLSDDVFKMGKSILSEVLHLETNDAKT